MMRLPVHTLMVMLMGSSCAYGGSAVDWERRARETNWWWPDQEPDLLNSVITKDSRYNVELRHVKRDIFLVRILSKEKKVFEFQAHRGTVFEIKDDTIVFPQYIKSSTGASVVAHSLKTGRKLWETRLKGIGPVSHFRYNNTVFLDVIDEVVHVYGRESFGRYVEYLDAKTGDSLGHRVFERTNIQAVKPLQKIAE